MPPTCNPRPGDRARLAHTDPLPPTLQRSYNASFPSDLAPQLAPLKAVIKPEPVTDAAESCDAKSPVILEPSSFKAISTKYCSIYISTVQCIHHVQSTRMHVAHDVIFVCTLGLTLTLDLTL